MRRKWTTIGYRILRVSHFLRVIAQERRIRNRPRISFPVSAVPLAIVAIPGDPGPQEIRGTVSVESWTLDRYHAGQLAESRIIMDVAGMLMQLGVIPALAA